MVLFKFIGAVSAFLYPAYSSYKALSKRPTDDVELERWTMYWTVLGILLTLEQIFFLITYLPFYTLFRTIFLLYLVLPQIQGSTYIYKIHLHPFLVSHEDEIDGALSRWKEHIWREGKKWIGVGWEKVVESLGIGGYLSAAANASAGQQQQVPMTPPAAGVNAAQPPTLRSPLAGSAQLVGSLWKTYGPTLLATGASFVERTQHQTTEMRKRTLEAELASLNASTSSSSFANPPPQAHPTSIPMPEPVPYTGYSINNGNSDSSGDEKEKKYEEISREEVPLAGHPTAGTPSTPSRSSWFGGWGTPKGYEKVKSE